MAEIRAAAGTDIPGMVRLLEQLFAIEEDFTFDHNLQQRGLELLLASAGGTIMVADSDGVVGMASGQIVISTAEGAASLWVEDLFVDRRHRRRGVGTRLLQEISSWGLRRGARRVQLLADRGNAEALDFYSRSGWVATNLICLRRQNVEEDNDSNADT